MTAHECLLTGATLVTMDPEGRVREGDLLLRGQRIAWVGPRGRAPRPAAGAERTKFDVHGLALLPGFVQCHVHLCQVLFRGLADDLPLLPWLKQRIWPLEAAHDGPSLVASVELGLSELLLGGTTTLLDMGTVHHHEQVFDTLERFGVRAMSGKALMDSGQGLPKGLRQSTSQALRETEALARDWHGRAGGRLRYAHAPRFVLSCSERLLREVAGLAAETGTWLHTHAAEHAAERKAVWARFGRSDVRELDRLGQLGPRTVLAHGVQLTAAERRLLARRGTRIAHCPSTNLKLASGVADVVALRDAGLPVGIGTDGAPCNNRLDALGEARLAALLAKVRRNDAAALPALSALRLITSEGARVLGLEEEVGSLEVGKRADVVAVSVHGPHQAPSSDVLSTLAYASSAADVRHVWIDGRQRVRDGELLGVDVGRVIARARRQATRTALRAGL